MSAPDKFQSTSRLAVAVTRCSPLQTSILADIAEALAVAGPSADGMHAKPIISCLCERFCLECGGPGPGCPCRRDE